MSIISPNDEEVVQSVQAGDIDQYETIIERYQPKLTRYGNRFLSHPDDLADLVQEVFIKAYTNLQSFNPQRRFSPWIYRIAHNTFVNHLRSKSRSYLDYVDFDTFFPHPHHTKTPHQELDQAEQQALVNAKLDTISPKYREVLLLYYVEEFDYQEISDILHIPKSTVGVRLSRAKNLLKKSLLAYTQE